jgi:5-methylcytosine-specific restriction endonuclease McrA
MDDVLHKNIVLVLNRNWQAINVTSPANAFCQMSTDSATGLDILGHDHMLPVTWDTWLALPVRPEDHSIGTARGAIRVPTVIVLARFDRVPIARPKLTARNIWQRDGGLCQYTGRPLTPSEGNIDHIIPRSRGGETSWENCVLACRKVNSRKGDRTPEEAGLRLLRQPAAPRALPVTMTLRNTHDLAVWDIFLGR